MGHFISDHHLITNTFSNYFLNIGQTLATNVKPNKNISFNTNSIFITEIKKIEVEFLNGRQNNTL